MNKRLFLTLSISLFFFITQAQTSKYRFTVFANPCINWYNSDVKSTRIGSATFGYDIGFSVDKYFAEHYAINSGVSISLLGGNLKNTYDYTYNTSEDAVTIPANTFVKQKLQYITVPIGFKFTSREIGYTTIYANLGFANHLNINAKATSSDNGGLLDNDNISKDINFYNLSYFFGAGVMYSLGGNTAIVFGINFSNGIIDVTDNSRDKITTSSIAFKIGMQF